ncbi:unnamed protein product [Blepharisma stoltei]|uniref:SecA family profile domain-containing protein n=1 Tax=Blepharisma stoltei TaxID=1481888 RepID=A0AAU9IC45_9CILI|nr:unnamed protein product [Blepharisma stoltei]
MVEKLKPEVLIFNVIDVEIKNTLKISSSLELKFQLFNEVTGKFVHQSDNEILNKSWRIYSEVEKYDQDFLILKALSSDLIELGSANIRLNQNFPDRQVISIKENGEEIIDVSIEIILQEINEESWNITDNELEMIEGSKTDLNLEIKKNIYFDEKPINNDTAKPDDNESQFISQAIDETKEPLLEEKKNEAISSMNLEEQSQLDQLTEGKISFAQDPRDEDLHDLQQKIQEGFAKHEINDKEQLYAKIQDSEENFNFWMEKGNHEEAREEEKILIELNKLLTYFEKVSINYETIDKPKIDLDSANIEINIEEEFKLRLAKYNIKNHEGLLKKIKDTNKDIKMYKKLKKKILVDKAEETLEELEYLCSLRDRLVVKTLKEREINYIQSKINFLDDLYEDAASMAESLEKHLSKILCYFSSKSFNFELPQLLLEKINQIDLDQEFEILNELAKRPDEKIDCKLANTLKEYSEKQTWESAIGAIRKNIRNVSPINFKELFRLIEKSKMMTENLENKDIILLIGSTGCGKSTTVHFLAGSMLTKVKENGIEHIIPFLINDEALKKVNVSNLYKSETKHITAVKIPTESEIFVCDTPGLMDTAGAEVDIANTIGIANAIQKCKSVRPLILLSGKADGDRFQGFKKLANSLSKFCPGLKKYSQSFGYAFTKYDKDEIENIHGRINNLLTDDSHDSLSRELIEDIEEKTRKEINVIYPLTDNPEHILHKILDIIPIDNPDHIFNCFLTSESREKIQSQIDIHKGEIETALRKRDYSIIKDRLEDLKTLSFLFKEYEEKYKQCVDSVIEGTNEIFHSATKLFNSSVHEKNVLLKDIVEAYKCSFNEIKESEKIRESHLKGETPSPEEFLNNIEQQLKWNEKNNIENFDIEVAKAKLKNLSLIAEFFEEFNGKNSELKLIYENFIINMIKEAEKSFEIKDFNLCSSNIRQVKTYLKNIGEYLNLSDLDIKYKELLEIIKSSILAVVGNLAPLYAKDKTEENDIDTIINHFEILSNIKEIDMFKEIIDIENLESSIANAVEQYSDHYNKLSAKIFDIIKDNDTCGLSAAKAIFEEMELLTKINEIEVKVSAAHKGLKFEIERKMMRFKNNIKEILNSFANSERIDFKLLSISLAGLKEGEWFEKYCPGVFESELGKINQEIMNFVDEIDSKFKYIDLSIEHSSSIKKAFDLVNQMKSIETLKEFIPSLEKIGESYCNKFESSINQVLHEITSEFLHEKEDSKSFNEDQNNLKTDSFEENYHEDIDEIKTSANEEEKQIKSTQTKENTLNWTKANHAFNYLKICKEISYINSECLWTEFTEFLQKSWQQINQSFDNSFNIIQRFINKEPLSEAQCKEASQGLYLAYEKGIDIRNKSQSIVDYLKCENTLEEYNTKIIRIEQELFNTSEHYKHENQINQYYLSLLIFESLSLLDQIIANKTTFSKRFSNIQDEFFKQIGETEKNIINFIHNLDFSEAERLINSLDKLNKRGNFRMISNKIQSVISNLMLNSQHCLEEASIKTNDENINNVVENQKNIKNAKEKIFSYIDEETKLILFESETQFYSFLADRIKNWIIRIEQAINKYSYYDAETFIGNLEKISCILSFSEITSLLEFEISDLKIRIENLPQSFPENFESIPIESYKDCINPKYIIKELEKAAQKNPHFIDCIEKIKQILNKKIEIIEEEMSKSNYYDKKQKIKSIERIHQNLPEEIEKDVKLKIKEWIKSLKLNKEERAILLENATRDKDLEKLCQIIIDDVHNRRGSKSINDSKNRLKSVLSSIIDEACHALKQNDLELALEKATIYEHYKSILKALGNDGKNLIDKKLGNEINKKFDALCRCIWNLKDEKADVIVNNWKDFQRIVEFNIRLTDIENGYRLSSLDRLTQYTYSTLSDFFISIHRNYSLSKPPNNTQFTKYYLDKISEYDILLKALKEFKSLHCGNCDNEEIGEEFYYDSNPIKLYLNLSYCQNYSEIRDELNNEFGGIVNYLKSFTVQDDEIKHEKILDDRFKLLKEKFHAMIMFEEIKNHISNFSQYFDECIKSIKAEIDLVKQSTLDCIAKDDFLDADYAKLRIGHRLLSSFKNSIHLEGIDLTQILDKIENTIRKKAENYKKIALGSFTSIDDATKSLISIKTISINFPPMKKSLEELIDQLLIQFKSHGNIKVRTIYDKLEKENTGLIIINEHKFFETEKHRLWAERTEKFNIDYVMERIDGSNIDKTALREQFVKYSKFYKKISSKYIEITADSSINDAIDALSGLIITKFSISDFDFGSVSSVTSLNKIDKKIIPKLLAYLATLWTLLNIKKTKPDLKEKNDKEILSPHPVQVLSIFRMIGIGYSGQITFANNLIQILTGEGKSVTLGLASAILAILGFSVRCACYSEHLSKRDHEEFSELFSCLHISNWIDYGTFNELCENEINSKIDIREFVKNEINQNSEDSDFRTHLELERPRILLIDEVDVFFGKSFYGKIFRPAATLQNDFIKNLINLIWSRRNGNLNLADILKSQEFIKCRSYFSNYQELIVEAVKDMIYDLQYLDSHEYILQDDRIGYKMHDGVSFHTSYGYYTMWTYYKEHENNRISKRSLGNHIGISIRCGDFSYAEMPNNFTHIMGVTGTLKTLGHHEKNIIENDYNIRNYTYMPSVFGDNNRIFRENADIYVENDKQNYFQRISDEINNRMIGSNRGERAILIFFETSEKLLDFYNTSNPSWKKYQFQMVTEDLRSGDRYRMINQATISGYVSLFTRVFGRGIDFKCQNQTVESSGGVHVIQTFLSEEASEETQIMGRSARQGQQGSFSMVLFAEELQKFQINDIDILNARNNSTIYDLLRQKRNEFYETKNSNENKHVKYIKQSHDRSIEFLNNITHGNLDGFKSFILEQNISNFTENSYNIIILLQATEPMSHLLQNAKNTIGMIFKRAREILAKKAVSPGCFQIKYCIYRTSSCPNDLIFQASPWSNKPSVLESFIKEIRTQGGKGNEAINKALKYINDRHHHEKISKVILIGDFVNTASQSPFNNQFSKKKKHKSSQISSMEDYHEELAKAARNGIPIHGFYTSPSSSSAFEEIGETTRGANAFLDINSHSGAENLTNAICKEILRVASGEDAVNLYQRQYEMANFNRSFYSVHR